MSELISASAPGQGKGNGHIPNNNFYFDQIHQLFEMELYSNVLSLGSKVLTLGEKASDTLTPQQFLVVFQHCGDSAYRTFEYSRAEAYYRHAHQYYKCLSKTSSHQKDTNLADDCELRYKMHLCQMQCKKPSEALQTLQSIPVRLRTPKVHMALGRLLQQNGMERAAITAFKLVVYECPVAIEAIEALVSLGLKEEDVQAINQKKLTRMPNSDWYYGWIKGNCAFFSRDFTQAAQIFNNLQDKTLMQNNRSLLVTIGITHAHSGDYQSAILPLRLAHMNDPNDMSGMDLLAYLLWTEKRLPELEKLMHKLVELNHNEDKSEPWVALGYYAQLTHRSTRGLYFAHRSITTNGKRSTEGLIAKGFILLDLKRYNEALEPFREALNASPFRFEPHKGIVDCYLGMHRLRDAQVIATAASRKIGQTPRVLTMCASVLRKDLLGLAKAKTNLEKALSQDRGFLPALLLLVDIYEQESQLTSAINLLQGYVESQCGTSELHYQLATLLVKNNMEERAAAHFGVALRLDPANREARDGLNRLDPTSRRGAVHDSYDIGDDIDMDDEDDDIEVDNTLFNHSHSIQDRSRVTSDSRIEIDPRDIITVTVDFDTGLTIPNYSSPIPLSNFNR